MLRCHLGAGLHRQTGFHARAQLPCWQRLKFLEQLQIDGLLLSSSSGPAQGLLQRLLLLSAEITQRQASQPLLGLLTALWGIGAGRSQKSVVTKVLPLNNTGGFIPPKPFSP